MFISLKILLLLWLINFSPPLLAYFLRDKWNTPLDFGRVYKDGQPLFGDHKTVRGIVAAVLMGILAALALGFPAWLGLVSASLSMAGDLLSSFIKRRRGVVCGGLAPGLDQFFEGAFPFLMLSPYCGLGLWNTLVLVLIFGAGAYWGAWFLKAVVLDKPYEEYPRSVSAWVRLREIKSCQITSNPFHHFVNFEDSFYYHIIMKSAFKLLGVYEKGKANALKVKKTELSLSFPDLPASFDGYRILFFSDLHLDGLDGLAEVLAGMLEREHVDLCILGGDFRMETHGPFREALARLDRVLPHIHAVDGMLGVLGNHDCLEFVEPLKDRGIRFLINDSCAIERNGDTLWFAGVDDPHYYKCHNVEEAFEDVPRGAFTLFVAHSNEIYREATLHGPRLYLCGHSHAGQIQLPRVGPLFTHSSAPRYMCEGSWTYGDMQGYTTRGAGVSGVPVRFACQGEIVVITLERSGISVPAGSHGES